MRDKEQMSVKKSVMIWLAGISLLFVIATRIINLASVAVLQGNSEDVMTLGTSFGFIFPIIISILFLVFCCIVNNKNLALTGLPLIIQVVFSIASSAYSMVITFGIVGAGYAGYASVVNYASLILNLILSVVFAVFYILTVSGKLQNESTGKVVTFVFATIKIAISLISTLLFVFALSATVISPRITQYYLFQIASQVCDLTASVLYYSAMLYAVAKYKKDVTSDSVQ